MASCQLIMFQELKFSPEQPGQGPAKHMITEVAIMDVIKGKELEFENSFNKAQEIISSMPGYVSHLLQKCIEKENRYILFVNWETLDHHTVGFRESPEYKEWKKLLHHFYDPFPIVEHYQAVYENNT